MAEDHAFVALYEREAEPILLFLTRRTLDVEVALDLTAETFAQAWRSWPRVRVERPEEVRGWLFTIARRQLSRYLRRGRVERRALAQLGVQVPTLADEESVEIERAADLEGIRELLGGELQKLSADQRRAIQLRIVQEQPYPEVARQLGTSEQTARARVSRGLRALATALGPRFDRERSTP